MKATPVVTVLALAALGLPSIPKECIAHASSNGGAQSSRSQGGVAEELRQLRESLALVNRENARLALQVAGLSAANDQLYGTQKAFNRTRRLGLPIAHEAQQQQEVDRWLARQEGALSAPVEEVELVGYRAAVASVFSTFNIDRDRRELEQFLARHGVTSEVERARLGAEFVEAMAGWKGFLESVPAVQRMLAARGQTLASTPLPPDSARFLNSAVDTDLMRLAVVGNEYVGAKALFLEKVFTSKR